MDYKSLAKGIREIALAAGARILEIYNDDFEVRHKEDSSPVTAADEAAEKIIIDRLTKLAPGIPIVAEEEVTAGRIPDISGGRFWLVDPLDGTKEFISRNGEFTVNIALIEDRAPMLGTVYAPALGTLYLGWGRNATVERADNGKFREAQNIQVRPAPSDGLSVVASRSHRDPATDEFISKFDIKEIRSAGSSLKLCLVASGEADLYPRLGPTMEWDIAAGHAVLLAAGGSLTCIDGSDFTYGKEDFRNPFFVARGHIA